MSQIRADLWTSGFIRRHNDLGQMCVVMRRGDPIAGQIWIEVDHLDGTVSLYAPAPSLMVEEADAHDRLFQLRLDHETPLKVKERLDREAEFDPDFWLLSLETRNPDIGIHTVG